MPKLVPRFAQCLFCAGCKAVSLCYLSAQTNATSPMLCIASVSGSLIVWSKKENAIIPGKKKKKNRSSQLFLKLFFATLKFHKLHLSGKYPSYT